MRLLGVIEVHAELNTVFLEAEPQIELMNLRTRDSARCDEFVTARFSRRGDRFLHKARAQATTALRFIDINVFE